MNSPLIIIQARTSSTRLPGKVRMQIGSKPMISHVYDRCCTVATTTIAWAHAYPQIPEENVLKRFVTVYLEANEDCGVMFSPVIRITGDCPMLDTGVLARMIDLWRETESPILYTSPEWDGLDVEVIDPAALLTAYAWRESAYEDEHVTPRLRNMKAAVCIPLGYALRWSVDDEGGLNFVRRVFRACDLCEKGIPHHSNAEGSIGGSERRLPVFDLHAVPDGGLAECTAYPILKERIGGEVYVSS